MQSGQVHPYSFAIIGGGEFEKSLREKAATLMAEKYIRFVGWQRDMPAVYGALDGVVLTSLNEGTPVVIIEAMAAGKPVVATDVGGVRDLLGAVVKSQPGGFFQAERGLLVPPNSPKAIAEAMVYLRQNPKQTNAMTAKAQKWILKNYNIDRLVKDLKRLYLEIGKVE